jgi:hypothetical protein
MVLSCRPPRTTLAPLSKSQGKSLVTAPNDRIVRRVMLYQTDTIDPGRIVAAEGGPMTETVQRKVQAWLARRGRTPNLVWASGHNHISEIASLGVDDDALGTPLARFIEWNTAKEGAAA